MHCPIRHLEKIHSCVQDYIVHRSFFFFFTTSVLKKKKKLCKALDLCFTGWHSVLALLPPVLLSTFLVPFCSPAGGLMPLPCPCSLALPSPIFFCFVLFLVCVCLKQHVPAWRQRVRYALQVEVSLPRETLRPQIKEATVWCHPQQPPNHLLH